MPRALSLLTRFCSAVSAILFVVRNSVFLLALCLTATVLLPRPIRAAQAQDQAQQPPSPVPATTPAIPQAPVPSGPVIVLDPAHGGTDSGARGEGAVEKDIVLSIARSVRAELERQGFRVIMTRNDDSNPSYDDRAGMANAYRDAVFVSIHVSSTGAAGMVRAYYDQFGTPAPPQAAASGPVDNAANPPANGLVVWEEAQRSYLDASRRFADLMQGEFVHLFPGSPALSTGVAVRALRSVTMPAVAIEISSISSVTPEALTGTAGRLSAALEKSVAAFHPADAGGAK